jgi:2,3-bisphosphoglycerate-independent phosphoglycerate mutase
MAENKGVKTIIHPILDGRDTPPNSGVDYMKDLMNKIETKDLVKIGSLCGRFYAMDRDKRWERVEKAYNLYTKGIGNKASNPEDSIKDYYSKDITDEFVEPTLIETKEDVLVNDGDGIIFFNFRADRAREITEAFTADSFDNFSRDKKIDLSGYVCMTTYDKSFGLDVAFPPVTLKNNLGEIISSMGLNQLRIAETEKYAHVTYFFNGGVEDPYEGEDRVLIPSPREVETYDEKPEMSAKEVSDKFISSLDEKEYDLMVLNFANMDMVGHTGNFEAAKKACEAVDKNLKPVVDKVLEKGGSVIITADHGNSEKMMDENGKAFTAHTTNPVNLVLIDDKEDHNLKNQGKLGDIAPTILKLMGLNAPKEMNG